MDDAQRKFLDFIRRRMGGFLSNCMQIPDITCSICNAPVTPGFQTCIPCGKNKKQGNIFTDRVSSITYAVKPNTQTYMMMKAYKNSPPESNAYINVTALLAQALLFHATCCNALSPMPIEAWTTVPSTRNHSREHPLHEIVSKLLTPDSEIISTPREGEHFRVVDENRFDVNNLLAAKHVLVIDDSWTSGASIQSISAALKSSGVEYVSVLTVSRILEEHFGPNPEFIRTRLLTTEFNPEICPWTASDCPNK